VIVIDENEVKQLLGFADAVERMSYVFECLSNGRAVAFPFLREEIGPFNAWFGIKSGYLMNEKLIGLKGGGYWNGNADRNIDRHQSTVLLFEASSGRPLAVVAANELTSIRTAAAAALSASLLSRENSECLSVIGAGTQSTYQVRAMMNVRKIKKVIGWGPTESKLQEFGSKVRSFGLEFVAESSPQRAVRNADIVVSVTPSRAPLIHAGDLAEGTHIAAMGSDSVGKHELGIDILNSARVFVDDLSQARTIGECQHISTSGVISEVREIGELVTGMVSGRIDSKEITVFDGTGLALQDIIVADFVLRKIQKRVSPRLLKPLKSRRMTSIQRDLDFSMADITATRAKIAPHIIETPVVEWRAHEERCRSSDCSSVFVKLELFQVSGTFKIRGVLNTLFGLSEKYPENRRVTTYSAGNHAVALAYGSRLLGFDAKVVMYASANPARISAAKAYGAEVVLVEDRIEAADIAAEIATSEHRIFVESFEGREIALGTATIAAEILEQISDIEALVVPVGGGGLAGGISAAAKMLRPKCRIFGVEPDNADVLSQSLAADKPITLVSSQETIADSLAPPFALPYSYKLCRNNLEEIVTVSDQELRQAMSLIFDDLKLAVEPACAASTAGFLGPLSNKLRGLRTCLLACGSNIDFPSYARHFDS
jgi:threonine dehydratase